MVDNLIKLFDSEETEFETNGLGVLADAETCEVIEERNGEFELEMEYPINGRHYDDISLRKIIVAKSNPYSSPQPFRIYSISKPIDGRVSINAEHISYDLSGYPVSVFSLEEPNTTIQNVFDEIKNRSVRDCPFMFWTNKIATGKFALAYPRSIRSLLAGSEGSILKVYGAAEYEFDNYSIKLWMSRGEDKGVTIRYGKNLTNVEQEENCSSVYTAVYPFWYSENNKNLVTLYEADIEDSSEKDEEGNNVIVHIPEKIVKVEGTFSFERILTLDMSDKFTEAPTQLELFKAANKYIKDNEIGIPKVSIEASFEPLSKTTDYKDYAILEEVRLCDTVHVEFPELGVSATAKCIKTVYDVLSDKYQKIELGSIKSNLVNSLSEQNKTLTSAASKTYVDNLIDDAASAISGNSGGYVVIHSSKGEKHPDEILIMDEPEIEKAKRIWRWNMSGLCYTDNYYSSFQENDKKNKGIAITMDGKIVADFIAGNMIQGVGLQTAPDSNGEIWFQVTQDGTLTARKGIIGGCEIQNGILKIKNANIEETLEGHIIKASSIEGSEFRSTPIEILNESGEKELKSLFEVTKEGQVYIRSEAIVNKLKVDQLEAEKFILSGVKYGEGSLLDIGTDEDSDLDAFRLSNSNGLLEARNAIIRGTIYSNLGNIAGLIMEKKTKTNGRDSKTWKVLRTEDSIDEDPVFEVQVCEEDKKSVISIQDLQCNKGNFSGSVTTNSLYVCGVKFSDSVLYINDDFIVNFNYFMGDSGTIVATLSNEKPSTTFTIKLTDSTTKEPYTLSKDKTFYIKIHHIMGKWEEQTIKIVAGKSEASQAFTNTFLGYDKWQFVLTGSATYKFTEEGEYYVDFNRHVEPYKDNVFDLGSTYFRWKAIYAHHIYTQDIDAQDVYTESGTVKKSDRNAKKDINNLNNVYEILFDSLRPVTYRFKENSSNRIHVGFIAQEVKEAIINSGLSSKDFAGYCEMKSRDGSKTYGLRYSEFIALNTYEIQKLKKKVSELENRLTKSKEI